MHSFLAKCRRFFREEHGPTAVEYAVVLSLIFAVCIVAITAIGARTNSSFQNAASSFK